MMGNRFVIAATFAALAMAAGCGETVDTSGLAPIDGYESWYRVDVTGDIPGHLDTYRIIYVNDIARDYAHVGDYPLGSVIVKEIREKDGADSGAIKYIALMRRLTEEESPAELDQGWLFTTANSPGEQESRVGSCWANCHAQAPYRGTWFDYGVD